MYMYYIRPLFYNSITVTLRFSHGFSTKCIGKKMMSIGVHQIFFFFDLGLWSVKIISLILHPVNQ